jgi:hypothetical protein
VDGHDSHERAQGKTMPPRPPHANCTAPLSRLLAALAVLNSPWSSTIVVEAWPSRHTDCSVFPELGQPQPRPHNHPPMSWLCEPVAGSAASFEWCASNCGWVSPNPTIYSHCLL